MNISDKITAYRILEEQITILHKEEIIVVNQTKASFKYADLMIKHYKKVNVIHKPIWIKFYSDWKNKKLTKDSYNSKDTLTVNPEILERFNSFKMVTEWTKQKKMLLLTYEDF